MDKHAKSVMVKHATMLGGIVFLALDVRRRVGMERIESFGTEDLVEVERTVNTVTINIIMKLTDASFRPVFEQLVDRASRAAGKGEGRARTLRLTSLYGFLLAFFDTLKVWQLASGARRLH